ncbi:hypothetical protein PR202_ga27737 [Eleusine coracana subsp. coracana]|uniref:Uncharacterized protein n=1 Tax=Eleusine coracana subsp. coracana TaxID=191504 RepID=A0AAV5DGS1_ELECO|nr:hypothetical protein PR202_ga27737 [Eleusine coracana subsp. coracana]
MGTIELHKTILHKIDGSRRSMFWKGSAQSKGGDCQVAWDLACAGRHEGGLGVRDLQTQNTCLLHGLLHKVVTRADSP